MPSIDITISGQKYLISGNEEENHLREVAELVRRKVENLKKEKPSLSIQKIAILSAIDLASEVIKGKKKSLDYQNKVLSKANELLSNVQKALDKSPSLSS